MSMAGAYWVNSLPGFNCKGSPYDCQESLHYYNRVPVTFHDKHRNFLWYIFDYNSRNILIEDSDNFYFFRYCNWVYKDVDQNLKKIVSEYLPQLFQPNIMCARSDARRASTCQVDSGSPLMIYNVTKENFVQVGIVAGFSVIKCF
jgi:hypothetical protein